MTRYRVECLEEDEEDEGKCGSCGAPLNNADPSSHLCPDRADHYEDER